MPARRLSAIALLCAGSLSAQPILTADGVFQAGDSSTLGFAISTIPFEDWVATTGARYTWDYSGAGAPGPWTSWTAPTTPYLFRAASTSGRPSFAGSQINEYSLATLARDLYFSWSSDRDTLYYDGIHTTTSYVANPHVPYLHVPMSFRDSGKAFLGQYGVPTQPTTRTGSVTRTWVYDGWGTLKLPYGTVPEVVRLRTRQVDSSIIGTFVMATVYEELIWFRTSDGIPVLRLQKQGAATSVYHAGIPGGSSAKRRAADLATGIVVRGGALSLRSGAAMRSVRLLDATGRMVFEADGSGASIAIPGVSKGVYLAKVLRADGSALEETVAIP